jgi:hypothetical protein
MAVTEKSKMRAAVEVSVNYAGERVQTLRFPEKPTPDLQANIETTRHLLRTLGSADLTDGNKPSWSGVNPSLVIDFLNNFRVVPQTAIDPRSVVDYIDKQVRNGELTRWRILVSCARQGREGTEWEEDLGVVGMARVPLIARSRLRNDPTSLGVITEPDDELFGLSGVDIRNAEDEFRDQRYASRAEAYRGQRDPKEGLLMLYPISAASEEGRNARNRMRLYEEPAKAATLVAYAVSFPFSTTDATVEYVSAPPPQGTL